MINKKPILFISTFVAVIFWIGILYINVNHYAYPSMDSRCY